MTPPLETIDETRAAYAEADYLRRLAVAVLDLWLDAESFAALIQRAQDAGREPSMALRETVRDALARHAGPAELADMLEGRAAFEQFCTTHDAGGGAFRMYVAPLRENGGRQGGAG